MTFDENACIRYLMKEMDPSEEMLFEKKMMEDENLLIEVESLRKVNQRLADLPRFSPPDFVTEQILQDACDHYKKNSDNRSQTFYISAAATFLVIFISGAFLIFENQFTASEQQSNAPVQQESSSGQATVGGSSSSSFEISMESTPSALQPWVDNNQELHFYDRFEAGGENAAAFDSIFHSSFERLRPLQSIEGRYDRMRNLHLTGSQN